ncbi:MAG: TIGR03960 family B12-binding radical SAM protein [Desulfobacterales bacterium]|nr:TIGR03960 family B12-binding radical SAM protein [Desulfobacterales bacterium]
MKGPKAPQALSDSETGTIRKDRRGRLSVAIVYPNTYPVGMSNLGFQTVYRLFNTIEPVVCERAFLPEENTEPKEKPITTIESGRSIADFDIIAFSVSFENDYPNIATILQKAGLPLRSRDREASHPLVIAGGVACFLNPEAIASFIDCFLIGEAEAIVTRFIEYFQPGSDRRSCLKTLARNVPGAYVPAFYKVEYKTDGTIGAFEPTCDVPTKIRRIFVKDISHDPTCTTILTPYTTFDQTFLIEVGRGCFHGCRFCSAGYIYRPPRFRSVSLLKACIAEGATRTRRIGLVGTAVSDFPGINDLCRQIDLNHIKLSFSSLRADALSPELISVLKQSDIKTATIAPDAGSERMRKVINKGLSEEDILNAAETFVANDIPNLKVYFMIGLPTEGPEDVEAIIKLCKRIKHRFLIASRIKKRIGKITVSLNCFVPKPFTPFQWAAMDTVRTLKDKIKKIKTGLKKTANVHVNADVPRWAYIQTLLARGDRRVAEILYLAHCNRGNWSQTLKSTPLNPDFYVYREHSMDEILPWDFIDHGIEKSFLVSEYQKAKLNQTSPPCPMDSSCNICGVCGSKPQR